MAIKALRGRARTMLKGGDVLLAKTFVDAVQQLPASNELPEKLKDFPHLSMIHMLSHEPLSKRIKVGIEECSTDDIFPQFDQDGGIVPDSTSLFTLVEEAVEIDTEFANHISPYFSSLEDAEQFFKNNIKVYCQYLINVDARLIDKTADKVSNFCSVMWSE